MTTTVAVSSQEVLIDQKELLLQLWKGRWFTFFCLCCAIGLGVLVSRYATDIYQSEATLIPARNHVGMGESSGGAMGGLAMLSGIGLGVGKSSQAELDIATMKSRQFIIKLIDKYQLAPLIIAVKDWDMQQQEVIFDTEKYNPGSQIWLDESGQKTKPPSVLKLYKEFMDNLIIDYDSVTQITKIKYNHISPKLSKEWIEILINEFNLWARQKSVTDSTKRIQYLKTAISNTKVAEMKASFMRVIESQLQSLMMAEVQEDFAFEMIDPPLVPESPIRPNRALIMLLSIVLGVLFSWLVLIAHFLFKSSIRA